MNSPEPDNRIQQLFSEQRAADGRRAPSFERTWRLAAARLTESALPMSWGLRLAMASCAVLLAAVSVFLWNGTSKPVTSAKVTNSIVVASLTDWTSPTDCLLESFTWPVASSSKQ